MRAAAVRLGSAGRLAAKPLIPAALLASALIGYAASIAGYLEYAGSLGVCESPALGAAFSCERVYSLPQARIAGVHLSEAAPVYFTALALLAVAYSVAGVRAALKPLAALSGAGAALIPYLVYLEVFVAGALCLWCTVMHASILAVLTLSAYSLARGR
jgi:uncharacterized membrane protein